MQAAGTAVAAAPDKDLLRATSCEEDAPALTAPTEGQDLIADYRSTCLTLGRHPLALLRRKLLLAAGALDHGWRAGIRLADSQGVGQREDAMCYGQPDELLKLTIGKRELPKNDLGHSPLDDFEHFCAYTGCSEQDLGQRAFAFVRLAYITASLNPREFRYPPLGEELEKACADIAMLLRDRAPGTTADIIEDSVLYWDDGRLNGARQLRPG